MQKEQLKTRKINDKKCSINTQNTLRLSTLYSLLQIKPDLHLILTCPHRPSKQYDEKIGILYIEDKNGQLFDHRLNYLVMNKSLLYDQFCYPIPNGSFDEFVNLSKEEYVQKHQIDMTKLSEDEQMKENTKHQNYALKHSKEYFDVIKSHILTDILLFELHKLFNSQMNSISSIEISETNQMESEINESKIDEIDIKIEINELTDIKELNKLIQLNEINKLYEMNVISEIEKIEKSEKRNQRNKRRREKYHERKCHIISMEKIYTKQSPHPHKISSFSLNHLPFFFQGIFHSFHETKQFLQNEGTIIQKQFENVIGYSKRFQWQFLILGDDEIICEKLKKMIETNSFSTIISRKGNIHQLKRRDFLHSIEDEISSQFSVKIDEKIREKENENATKTSFSFSFDEEYWINDQQMSFISFEN